MSVSISDTEETAINAQTWFCASFYEDMPTIEACQVLDATERQVRKLPRSGRGWPYWAERTSAGHVYCPSLELALRAVAGHLTQRAEAAREELAACERARERFRKVYGAQFPADLIDTAWETR